MAVAEMNPAKYGRLLVKALPKVIETREEFDHYVEMMEALDRQIVDGHALSPEQEALLALLEQLVKGYDDKIVLPQIPAHEMIQYLMEQRGLKQADLLPIFGSRSVASEVVSGKREPSKAHIRKLAEFFRVSPALFF